jgi:hypothetical protein
LLADSSSPSEFLENICLRSGNPSGTQIIDNSDDLVSGPKSRDDSEVVRFSNPAGEHVDVILKNPYGDKERRVRVDHKKAGMIDSA